MSREYESGIVVGYSFHHEELLSFMKNLDSEIWDESYFEKNKGYNAMIAEEFAEKYGLVAHQDISDENKEHIVGLKIECGLNHKDFTKSVELSALKVKRVLKADLIPNVYSTLMTY